MWLPATPAGAGGGGGAAAADVHGDEVLKWCEMLEKEKDNQLNDRSNAGTAAGANGGANGGANDGGGGVHESIVSPLLTLTAHESGVPTSRTILQSDCATILTDIARTVAPPLTQHSDVISTDIDPTDSHLSPYANANNGGAGAAAGAAGGGGGVGSGSSGGGARLNRIPFAFFHRNEQAWRGSVNTDYHHNKEVTLL